MSAGEKPDYYVGCLDTATDRKNHRLGAAWRNDDGSISIKLDDFITITGGKTTYLRLFPNDRSTAKAPAKEKYTTRDLEQDITPF